MNNIDKEKRRKIIKNSYAIIYNKEKNVNTKASAVRDIVKVIERVLKDDN